MMIKGFLLYLLLSCPFVECIIGYNCDKPKRKPLRYSSTDVQQCPEKIEGWFEEGVPVSVQLIQIPSKETMTAYKCSVAVETVVEYCGRTDSIRYGGQEVLGKNEAYVMPIEDCNRLVHNQVMTYKSHTWPAKALYFSKDVVVQGSRDEVGATCTAAEPFESHGRNFTHSILRNIVSVHLTREDLEYNSQKLKVNLDDHEVAVTKEAFSGTTATWLWNDPSRTCSAGENMREGYTGEGLLYKPVNPNLPQMLLVNNKEKKQIFGIELGGQEDRCKFTVFKTQLQEIRVSLNITKSHNWKIPNLRPTSVTSISAEDNLQGLLGYNFVSITNKVSKRLKLLL